MVDNVQISAMTGGDFIGADEVAGVKYQRVKIGHGADGAYADVGTDAPLPVSLLGGTSIGSDRVYISNPTQLPDHPQACGVTVRAAPGNTGKVYVGGVGVSPLNGFELAPGEALSLDVVNTNAIHVDADDDGDSVYLVWVNT